jgi:hypothetical protein
VRVRYFICDTPSAYAVVSVLHRPVEFASKSGRSQLAALGPSVTFANDRFSDAKQPQNVETWHPIPRATCDSGRLRSGFARARVDRNTAHIHVAKRTRHAAKPALARRGGKSRHRNLPACAAPTHVQTQLFAAARAAALNLALTLLAALTARSSRFTTPIHEVSSSECLPRATASALRRIRCRRVCSFCGSCRI